MVAKIKEKKEIAKGTLEISFEAAEEVSFKPGQFMTISLINPPYNDEKGVKRHFSILNSPNLKDTLSLASREGKTAFKKSLKEIPVGSEIEVHAISGNFVLPDDKTRPLVFIAGGIGITPFISILRYVKEEGLDYKITLIYSNRDKDSTAFFEELTQLEKELPNFKLVLTMTEDSNWQGEKRIVNAEFIKDYFKEDLNGNTYYVVGPPAMVSGVYQELKNALIEPSNIKIESYTGY